MAEQHEEIGRATFTNNILKACTHLETEGRLRRNEQELERKDGDGAMEE
jgi:hypothetical protein